MTSGSTIDISSVPTKTASDPFLFNLPTPDVNTQSWILDQLTSRLLNVTLSSYLLPHEAKKYQNEAKDFAGLLLRVQSTNDVLDRSDGEALKSWRSRYSTIAQSVRQDIKTLAKAEVGLDYYRKLLEVAEQFSLAWLIFTWKIKEMPPEILSSILFYAVLPSAMDSAGSRWRRHCLMVPSSVRDNMPKLLDILTLSHVCRRWREIIFADPRIWCALDPSGLHSRHVVDNNIISRLAAMARTLPLSISLDLSGYTKVYIRKVLQEQASPRPRSNIRSFRPCLSNASHLLGLHPDGEVYNPGPQPDDCWNELETLEVDILQRDRLENGEELVWLKLFRNAPKLSSLRLCVSKDIYFDNIARILQGRWSGLVSLQLTGSFHPNLILALLRGCKRLEQCAITFLDTNIAFTPYQTVDNFGIPNLRELLLLGREEPNYLLQLLEPPALKTLCIGTRPRRLTYIPDFKSHQMAFDFPALANFLQVFPPRKIENLALHRFRATLVEKFKGIWESIPYLRALEVSIGPFWRTADVQELIGHLVLTGPFPLLPRLTRLILYVPYDCPNLFTETRLKEVIESRRWFRGAAEGETNRLESLELVYDEECSWCGGSIDKARPPENFIPFLNEGLLRIVQIRPA